MVRISRGEYKEIMRKIRARKGTRAAKRKEVFADRPIQWSNQALNAKLDGVVSWWVRSSWARRGCPFHFNHWVQVECCYHVEPRSNWLIRWLPLNLVGACFACNDAERLHRGKPFMEQRHRDVLGCDRHELLKLLSGKSPKFTRDEKLAMIDEFARRTEAHSFVLFVPAPIQQRIDLAVANTSSAGLAAAENIRTIGGNQ